MSFAKHAPTRKKNRLMKTGMLLNRVESSTAPSAPLRGDPDGIIPTPSSRTYVAATRPVTRSARASTASGNV